jgi:ligand-binding SRPBCC domain-containing protein
MAIFEETILLPIPRAVLFDFLLRPANVAKISDGSLALKFTEAPEVVSVGSRILIEMVVMGQLQKATHEITVCTRPDLIVEVQIAGPMKSWQHEHKFEDAGDQTRMTDRIEYTKPGGIVGLLLSEAKINDMLEENFFQREQNIRRLIDQGKLT